MSLIFPIAGEVSVSHIRAATIAAIFFSFGLAPSLARADCASDIEQIEEELNTNVGESKAAAGDRRAARKLVEKAKSALAEGKERKCENLVKKARERLEFG